MTQETTLWTALITPMNRDGSIDFESLSRVAERQDAAGNGILLIGSTGEGLALSEKEKSAVVQHVSEMNVAVPVMVGVGGMNLDHQKKWIQKCNHLNIDAFLMVTPLYSKPGPKGQAAWFSQLLDTAEKPCMLYNIPSRTGIDFYPHVAKILSSHPNFWSIKEASGNIKTYQTFREMVPEISLFSGDDGLLAFFRAAGCQGLVSVSANVWPEATTLYTEKCLTGETGSLFPLWKRAVAALFSQSNPIPVKHLLHEKGVISTPCLRLPLLADELEDVAGLMQIDEEIETWYKKTNK
ncbi:MAG: 4-hydroxy-tetrahydrodipicolinate synthase [Balneolaceae bacterium]